MYSYYLIFENDLERLLKDKRAMTSDKRNGRNGRINESRSYIMHTAPTIKLVSTPNQLLSVIILPTLVAPEGPEGVADGLSTAALVLALASVIVVVAVDATIPAAAVVEAVQSEQVLDPRALPAEPFDASVPSPVVCSCGSGEPTSLYSLST